MRENRTPSEEKVWLKYYTEEQRNRITPRRTMYEHLYLSNVDHMNIHAIEYYGKSITFATLFQKIEDCAKALAYQGVKKGDIVAVCMPNLPEAVISVYAINKLGAIANMIHPLKSQNEIEAYILETKTKVVIALDSVVTMLSGLYVTVISCSPKVSMSAVVKFVYTMKQADKRKEGVVLARDTKARVVEWEEFIRRGRDTVYEDRKCDATDIAIMLHTGGTSGNEKTVALSNNNFNSMITQLKVVADNFSVGEKMLTIMPIFHGLGLCSSIHLPLCYGVGVILVPKFEKKEFAGLMKKKPNHIIGVPTLFNAMMNDKKINKMDLSHLKYVVYGGDAMKNEDAFNEFLSSHNASIDVQKGYGLSEAVAGVTFAFGACNKAESIGIPMININVKIVDIHTKEELDYNQVGEICISGPTVMDGGYYNKPQETANVLEKDEKGVVWLHTGDMGYMDSDGVLFYSQRVDRMFQSSGVNVYPEGIEKILLKAERVSSCVVVSQKHDYKGKVPVAFVVLENKEITIPDDLSKELEQLCKQNLDRYHQPSRIIAIREIPETKLGKRDYRTLEKKAERKIR